MISENKNTFLITVMRVSLRLMKSVLLIYHTVVMVFHSFSLSSSPCLSFILFLFCHLFFPSFLPSFFLLPFFSLSTLSGTKNKKRQYSTNEEKKGAEEYGKKGVEEGKEELKEGKEENKNGNKKEGRKDEIKKRRKGGRKRSHRLINS